MAKSISIDELADIIVDEIQTYGNTLSDNVKTIVKKVSDECKNDIKANSPVGKGAKHYKDGWTTTTVASSSTSLRMSVHNKKKPGLAHLLENGHAKVGGGRVEGHPHIAPAEEKANAQLEKLIKEAIQK